METNDRKKGKENNGASPRNVLDLTQLIEREETEEEIRAARQKERERKKDTGKKPEAHPVRRRIGDIVIITLMLITVFAAFALTISSLTTIEEITVTGNTYTEEEPLIERYFPTEKSRLLSRTFFRGLLDRNTPESMESVKLVLHGTKSCEIRTVEKEAAFTIALRDEEGVVIVTADGAVLTKAAQTPEHLSLIAGILATNAEPLFKCETDQPETYDQLIRVIPILREYQLDNDAFYIRNGSFCLDFGEVTVSLGTDQYLREKLTELQNQIPSFAGLKGTLHLEDYDGGKNTDRFTFEVRP